MQSKSLICPDMDRRADRVWDHGLTDLRRLNERRYDQLVNGPKQQQAPTRTPGPVVR